MLSRHEYPVGYMLRTTDVRRHCYTSFDILRISDFELFVGVERVMCISVGRAFAYLHNLSIILSANVTRYVRHSCRLLYFDR